MSIKDNNHFCENFFTKEDVDFLKKTIYDYYNSTPKVLVDLEDIKQNGYPQNKIMIQPWSGRSSFDLTPFISGNILNKLKDYVSSYKNEIDWYSFLFVRYSNEFGMPLLSPHCDDHDTNFTIDYQLDSNTNWAITIEDKDYMLVNNSAAIFSPSEQVHWRNHKKFLDGEYVDMLLFYFTTKTDSKKLTFNEKREIEKKYKEKYFNNINSKNLGAIHNNAMEMI